MTVFSFSGIVDTTVTFTAASDILSLPGDAADYTMANDGDGNMTVTNSAGSVVTLTGMTLNQITTVNMLFSGSASNVIAGDNSTATTSDDLPQAAAGTLDLVAAAGSNLDANNLLFGLGEGDTITVGNGDNVIFGGSGASDSLDGSDTITIDGTGTESGSNKIYLNAGNDTVLFTDPTGSGKSTTIWGGIGDDDVVVGIAAGEVIIRGGAGADTMNGAGATGNVTIYGGGGAADSNDEEDLITTGAGTTTAYGNAGDDSINFDDFASTATQTIYGGAGADTIMGDVGGAGSAGALLAYGNAGADVLDISTHLGEATIYGGGGVSDSNDGADSITVGAGNASHDVTVYGNAGDDTITSGASLAAGETITLYGGKGADTFTFSGDRNLTSSVSVYGNAGNDIINLNDSALTADATFTLAGFEEEDTLNLTMAGGTATDLVVTGLGESVTIENGAADGKYVFTNYTDNFSATNLVLSDGSSLVTNFGGDATSLSGTANADQIIAGAEGDTISAAAGADLITGGDGADNITGGDGVDTITGGEGNDTIDAGDGGADGGTADSSVQGGTGADSLIGGAFEDSMDGGNGNDTLAGGADADTLTGGAEADTFEYAVAEVDATDTNVDLITDAFTGSDVFSFSDLSAANLRGDGTDFAKGSGTSAQALGADVGMYVATNSAGSFSEANIYTALSGIADDFAASDIVYVMISDGSDARLVRITEAANAGTLVAADDTLEFVARLSGVSTSDLSALVSGNFAEFVDP